MISEVRGLLLMSFALSGCLQYTIADETIAALNDLPRSQWPRIAIPARRETGDPVYLRADGFRDLRQDADRTHHVRTASRGALIAGSLLMAAGVGFSTAGTVFAAQKREAAEVALWVPGAALMIASVGVFVASIRRSTYEVREAQVGVSYEDIAKAHAAVQRRDPIADSIKIRVLLACALMGKGDYEGAASLFEEVLLVDGAIHERSMHVHQNLATCYTRLGRMQDALREAETWLRAKPDDVRAQALVERIRGWLAGAPH